ncbi:signal recognition particle 19 kDa protein [Lepeophtheirus salmonis]|uniref:Signal recognition particle 19 kDa protein n=1 Tax=Lepeophtheirus salmonis TaxID=72036 RepID=C1BUT7_LEPSM|nr:signal recognition particle 19 kDa protein-like [Lepeophtheirus salmonis]ACO12790.1 Signal recognition particle 19 kDa protein [Lepeophtheirus salmonis]
MAEAQPRYIPVGPFDSNKGHADPERWVSIYPTYLNKNRTLKEGRRIEKSICVENPTYSEIRDALLQGGWNKFLIQDKEYPRERSREMLYRGKIRVQLKDEEGEALREEYPTRASILHYLGKEIPKIRETQKKAQISAKSEANPSQSSSKQSGGKKSKKKK